MSSVWNKDISSFYPRSACGYRDKYFKKGKSDSRCQNDEVYEENVEASVLKKHIILNTEQKVLALLKPLRLILCEFSSARAGIGIGTCLCIKHHLH